MPSSAAAVKLYQPLSLAGLLADDSNRAVVSFFEVAGRRTIISVASDDVWELWMYHEATNKSRAAFTADFRQVPKQFVPGAKAIYYRWWTAGMNGRSRPKATTLCSSLRRIVPFLRWLDEHGVKRLSDVTPFHTSAYAQAISKDIAPSVLVVNLLEVKRLYDLRAHSPDAIQHDPWPTASPCEIAGVGFAGLSSDEARTKIIPDDVLSKVFQHAEGVVSKAERLLAERESGQRLPWMDEEVLEIRAAILFLLGITTGMRNGEEVAVERGAARRDRSHGVAYAWVRSFDFKTGSGEGEWMAPEEAIHWLSILERWAKPYQEEAARRLAQLESDPPREGASRQEVADWGASIRVLKQSQTLVFLTRSNGGTAVAPMTNTASNNILRELFKSAGVDWIPETHQMRRTFAASCARHALGDIFYLKHHLKHRSMDMTALYMLNDAQDESLFHEIFDELTAEKGKLIEHWLDPETILGGGAAPNIRANQVATVESRRALSEDISDKVMVRATGHGWCLAHDDGCGGRGLYEATRCVGCRNSLFGERHIPIWKGILAQQEELASDVSGIGPGGVRRAERDAERARLVLADMGVTIDAV